MSSGYMAFSRNIIYISNSLNVVREDETKTLRMNVMCGFVVTVFFFFFVAWSSSNVNVSIMVCRVMLHIFDGTN